ncbi:FKBP-type peptidyl-prolyl cis-trans isomerase [Budvicia aquatica]|uniref:Peptidyl-prolyl cis-trans isomerase n=1 Tax=Budvicia aquatica TaxID=82979 RepID=A0A2C6BUS0_9GAMM|nr:FKBP-type peptidyl-prolyl cis-trans isomerase [Budvicia aquatica]PHI27900.1 FKBP-type peptidyl-prolyl cis-trans isomerase FkpA [Budvicia aquatica]VFS45633.1 FKBP-type peptidyl-prolyl cis-trans isomerase fkpA precursor [Budvicia aquatica]
MKSLFKVTLLATTMALATGAMAEDAKPKTDAPVAPAAAASTVKFDNEDQKAAYALGASLGGYMHNSLKEQDKLGVVLDRTQIQAGFTDAFDSKSKLSDAEIEQTLQAFEARIKEQAAAKAAAEAKVNEEKGAEYRTKFAKESGVKKTESGLLYKVDAAGTGNAPKDSDSVVVNYKGSLIDGTEFDNSYTRGQPATFRLDSVIPGWTEGLKHVKKGGKIKLVIPSSLAYGDNAVPGIPVGSTLVFDVEILDIKPEAKGPEPK